TTLESLELSHWNRVLAVNLGGPMLLAKHCAPYLRAHCGSIVNLTSTRSRQSEADTEAYAPARGGLMALTHALAISLGPEIRVNAVSRAGSTRATRLCEEPSRCPRPITPSILLAG
ncbi:SDR family oxidoreductase, partial [Pseudomonas syringae pv. actinidiae]|nr:SDR family oxidoreductase [Pseudomonas syringae pv. actinidiae]